MRRLCAFLLPGLLFFFVLLFSVEHTAGDEAAYHVFQVRHNISAATGRTQEELDEISADVRAYLKDGQQARMMRHFNERECLHMQDVFGLFDLGRKVRLVCGILFVLLLAFLLLREAPPVFAQHLHRDTIVWLGIFVVAGLVIALSFQRSFILFHRMFFDNDLWLLNPETDLMIQMMPESFFIGLASQIAWKTVLGYVLGMGILLVSVHICKKRFLRTMEA